MAGSNRREVTQDTLAGAGNIQPAQLRGPGLAAPAMPRVQPSTSQKIADELGVWATDTLADMANAQREQSMMDGAIAATQGKAMEDLVTEGADKFALEGYRVLTAQAISSQLQAAQVQLIEDSAFALGPDAYRAQLTEQLTSLSAGQDKDTARMIQETMTSMLPELVGRHTVAHANFQEDQTYTAVVQSISAMAKDDRGRDGLLGMALGNGTAAGLSDARLKQAIMEGVVLGFVTDSPEPYHLFKANGVFDDMTTDQLNRINDAKTQWQTKLRTGYNETRAAQHAELDARMQADPLAMTPTQFSAEHVAIDAQWQIDTDYADAGAWTKSAQDPARTALKTRWLIAEEARERKDHAAFASATLGIILGRESSPDDPVDVQGPLVTKGANVGTRGQGLLQVMPLTLKDPGFGIRPSDGTDADNYRVGVEYWAVLVQGSDHPSGLLNYAPMDVEAAAIAYNAGFVNASAWELAGRDYSVLPDRAQTEPYAKQANKDYDNQKTPLISDKYNLALHNLAETEKRVAVESYGIAAPMMAAQDAKFIEGTLDMTTWISNRVAIMEQYGLDATRADANQEIAVIKEKYRLASAQAKADLTRTDKRVDAAAMRAIDAVMFPAQVALDAVFNDPSTSNQDMTEALSIYVTLANEAFAAQGLEFSDTRNNTRVNTAATKYRNAIVRHETYAADSAEIAFRRRTKTMDQLSPKLLARANEDERKADSQTASDQISQSDQSPEAVVAIDGWLEERQHRRWQEQGQVEPHFRDTESNYINSGVMVREQDPKTGKEVLRVSQVAIDSVMRYRRFSQIAPNLASEFYDVPARTMADIAITLAGVGANEGQIGDALRMLFQEEALTKTRMDSLSDFEASKLTVRLSAEAVDDFYNKQDVQVLQAWVQGDTDAKTAFRVLGSEQAGRETVKTREIIEAGLAKELRALRLARPYAPAAMLVPLAMDRLREHSAFIGNTFIMTNVNMMQETFGSQAEQYRRTGIMDDVFRTFLSSPAMVEKHPEFSDSTWIESWPSWLQNLGAGAVDALDMGFEWRINEAMSMGDYWESWWRGLRPYTASLDADGNVVARVMDHQGNFAGPGEVFPWREAGEYYMELNPNAPDPATSQAFNIVSRGAFHTLTGSFSEEFNASVERTLSLIVERGVNFE